MNPQESPFYERCYRCRAVVPNGLVQRKMLQTGFSKRGGKTYQIVSLCGVCVTDVREEERHSSHRTARYWGVFWGTILLAYAGVLWPIGLTLMCLLAHYRMVGRALLAMVVTSIFYFQVYDYPAQLPTSFVVPWTGMMIGVIAGHLWQRYCWPLRWLVWKRPVALERKAS